MDERLSTPAELVIQTSMSPQEVAARLRHAVDDKASVEPMANSPAKRLIAGQVSGDRVSLWVRDANFITRRRGWDIWCRARILAAPQGATLQGTMEIAHRRLLRGLMWLIRVAGALIVALAVADAVRAVGSKSELDTGSTLASLAVGAVFIVGTVVLERDGERAAAQDAALLTRFLKLALDGQAVSADRAPPR